MQYTAMFRACKQPWRAASVTCSGSLLITITWPFLAARSSKDFWCPVTRAVGESLEITSCPLCALFLYLLSFGTILNSFNETGMLQLLQIGNGLSGIPLFEDFRIGVDKIVLEWLY